MNTQPAYKPAALARDMASFFRHPRPYKGDETQMSAGRRALRAARVWALLFSLLLPFLCVIVFVVMAFGALSQSLSVGSPGNPSTGGFDSQNALVDVFSNGNPLLVLFLAVVQAPLLEETAFRLWLKPTRHALSIGFAGLLYFAFAFARNLFTTQRNASEASMSLQATLLNLGIAIVIIAVLAFGLRFLFAGKRLAWAQGFYQRHYWLPVAASAVLFGGIHITNYTNPLLWLAAPVLVFPQFLLGVGLAYVRARFGFGYAIFMHMLHNGLLMTPALLSLQMVKLTGGSAATSQNPLATLVSVFVMAYCGLLVLLMALNAVWSIAELSAPKVERA